MGWGPVNVPMVAVTRPVGTFAWTSAVVMLILFVIGIGPAAREIFSKVPEGDTAGI